MREEKARDLAFAIIGTFEDLLDRHKLIIPSADREGTPDESCMYGSEYTELQDAIVRILTGGSQSAGMDEEEAREMAFSILQDVEELLDEKDITIPSSDREGREEEARIYGTEYYLLEDAITGILVKGSKRADKVSQAREMAFWILEEVEALLDRYRIRVPSEDPQRATSQVALCMPEWDRLRDGIVKLLRRDIAAARRR